MTGSFLVSVPAVKREQSAGIVETIAIAWYPQLSEIDNHNGDVILMMKRTTNAAGEQLIIKEIFRRQKSRQM